MLDSVSVSGGRIEITKDGSPRLSLEDIVGEASAASLRGLTRSTRPTVTKGARRSFASRPARRTPRGCFASSRRCATLNAIPPMRSMATLPALPRSRLMTAPSSCAWPMPMPRRRRPARADTAPRRHRACTREKGQGSRNARDAASFLELKGPLKATLDHAELPDSIYHPRQRSPPDHEGPGSNSTSPSTSRQMQHSRPAGSTRRAVRCAGRGRRRASVSRRGALAVRRGSPDRRRGIGRRQARGQAGAGRAWRRPRRRSRCRVGGEREWRGRSTTSVRRFPAKIASKSVASSCTASSVLSLPVR